MTSGKPNILLITGDELRKDALSCYGNRAIHTTNLDRLAGDGIQFERAYTVSPWCLPARCSILTGLFPHTSGAYSNFRRCPLDTGLPNIFTELRRGGYKTSLFGKCHFSPVPYSSTRPDVTLPYDEFRDYYISLGIDHLDLQDDKQVSVWFYDDYSKELDKARHLKAYRDATWDRSNAKLFPFPGPAEWHPDAWVGRKAVEYIEDYDRKKPLFAWVSFSGPHYPFDVPAEYLDRVDMDKLDERFTLEGEFDDPTRIHYTSYHGQGGIDGSGTAPDGACKNYSNEYWGELRKNYHANVALIDEQVGNILDVAKRKFGDNILVIFTADHGEMLGNHGLWGKNNCGYEDVWNIPMLVKYPDIKHHIKSDAMVMLTDILPTCLKAAGIDAIECDGMDLTQNMENGGYRYVFGEGEGYTAVSDGKVKYIHIQKNNENFRELIDISVDPKECRNLMGAPAYQKKLAELRGKLIELFIKKLLP